MAVDDGGKRTDLITSLVKLVFGVVSIGIAVLIVWSADSTAPPDVVRVAGVHRVGTAIQVSRFWHSPEGGQDHILQRSTASRDEMWAAAYCAIARDAPLLFEPPPGSSSRRTPRTAARHRVENRSAALAGQAVDASSCSQPVVSASNCDISPELTFSVVDVEGLQTQPPAPLPPCPRPSEVAPETLVVAAAKSSNDVPEVALAIVLAAELAQDGDDIGVMVVPPYLGDHEAQEPYRELAGEVKEALVVGQAGRVSQATQDQLRTLLTTQGNWLQAISNSLNPIEAIALALVTIFGAKAVADGSPTVIIASAHLLARRAERLGPLRRFAAVTKALDSSLRGDGDAPWVREQIVGRRVRIRVDGERPRDVVGVLANPPGLVAGHNMVHLKDVEGPSQDVADQLLPWNPKGLEVLSDPEKRTRPNRAEEP